MELLEVEKLETWERLLLIFDNHFIERGFKGMCILIQDKFQAYPYKPFNYSEKIYLLDVIEKDVEFKNINDKSNNHFDYLFPTCDAELRREYILEKIKSFKDV